jgi:cation transport ATPase
LNFIRQHAEVSENVEAEARKLADQGKTPLFFARNGRFLGMIAVADVIKEDSPQAVQELQNMGIRLQVTMNRQPVPSERRLEWTKLSQGYCRKEKKK